MMEALAALALISIALAWFSIPLIPTVVEMRRRTEARPLIVERENDGEVRHFARRFRAYLQANFRSPTVVDCIRKGIPISGQFHDGTVYRVVGRDVAAAALGGARRSMPGVVVFTARVVLPEGLMFSDGIYAPDNIDLGRQSVIRSLYGEGLVRLRERSVVSRWIHVGWELTVETGCVLYGRASADHSMIVAPAVEFERLNAPRILFRVPGEEFTLPQLIQPLTVTPVQAHPLAEGCYCVDGDLDVPPRSFIRGDFVVRGSAKIGSNSRVEGSIKSHGDMRVGQETSVEGSLVSGRDLLIGSSCSIRGPVVASRNLTIRTGCEIGNATYSTSAIAPSIRVEPGVLVFGTVWAREKGEVGGTNR